LFQKPRVIFVKEADVVDAVAEHGYFLFFAAGVSRKAAAGSSSDQLLMMRPR
jgi:hypothetical protein